MGQSAIEFLRQIAAQRNSKIDLGELADALLEEFQGVRGLAKRVRKEYDATKSGSMAKTAALSKVMEIIVKAGERGNDEQFAEMPEADLAAAITKAMQVTEPTPKNDTATDAPPIDTTSDPAS